MTDMGSVRLQQQDGAGSGGKLVLERLAQGIQHGCARNTGGDEFKNLSLRRGEPLRQGKLGNVDVTADHSPRLAVLAADQFGARFDPAIGAVLMPHAELVLACVQPPSLDPGETLGSHPVKIVRMDQRFPVLERLRDFVIFPAEEILQFRRRKHPAGGDLPFPESDLRCPGRETKPCIRLAQGLVDLRVFIERVLKRLP